MAYKLIISKEAQNELDKIIEYIALHLCNLKAAADLLDQLEKKYLKIIENPYMYSLSNDFKLNNMGYRIVKVKNYILLYRIAEDSHEIRIGGIFYEGELYVKKILTPKDMS